MKKYVFLLLTVLILGMFGCMMNQDIESTAESMKKYADDKYGDEFKIQYFQAAKDKTYTNILTLSDGEHLFNVYQSGDAEISDDFPQVVISQKMVNYLKLNLNSGYDIFAYFMFADGNKATLDYAVSSDVQTILKDNSLLKIIIVVKVNEEISLCSDELFDIYNEAIAFKPKYIDFEVIQVDNISFDLEKMLNNIPVLYDSDWNKYHEIKSHISVTDTNIGSPEELIRQLIFNVQGIGLSIKVNTNMYIKTSDTINLDPRFFLYDNICSGLSSKR